MKIIAINDFGHYFAYAGITSIGVLVTAISSFILLTFINLLKILFSLLIIMSRPVLCVVSFGTHDDHISIDSVAVFYDFVRGFTKAYFSNRSDKALGNCADSC